VLKRVELALKEAALHPAPDLLLAFSPHFTPPQGLDDALATLYSVARALHPASARVAIADAVDWCLEGYAVFPGSAGRRDLFNWWLIRVVPAAYHEHLPDQIYTCRWPWPPSA